jgi:hypothetical protein
MLRSGTSARVLLAIVLTILVACRDNLGPPTERGIAVGRPSFSQGPTFTGTLNPTSSMVSLGPTVIGNYPNALLAEVKVEAC